MNSRKKSLFCLSFSTPSFSNYIRQGYMSRIPLNSIYYKTRFYLIWTFSNDFSDKILYFLLENTFSLHLCISETKCNRSWFQNASFQVRPVIIKQIKFKTNLKYLNHSSNSFPLRTLIIKYSLVFPREDFSWIFIAVWWRSSTVNWSKLLLNFFFLTLSV